MFGPQRSGSIDELDDALVAQQPPDEEESRRAAWQRFWREVLEVDSRTGKHPCLRLSHHAPADEQGAVFLVLEEHDGRAGKADTIQTGDDRLQPTAPDKRGAEAADIGQSRNSQ